MAEERWICRRCAFAAVPGLPRPLLCPDDGMPLLPESLLQRQPRDPLLGTVVEQRWAVLDLLRMRLPGRGYLVAPLDQPERRLGLHAALIDEQGALPDQDRFLRTAEALRRFDHPGLLGLLAAGPLPEGGGYVVTDSVGRPHLATLLKSEGTPGWPAALQLLRPALAGLAEAHQRGVAHGALHPALFLLAGESGGAPAALQLAGLGFDRLFCPDQAGRGGSSSRVQLDALAACFMSPEEIRLEPLGPPSDVYSLGCLLHHLVLGVPPFVGRRPLEIISGHLSLPYPAAAVAEAVSPELAAVLARACSREQAGRQADARELLAALEATPQGSLTPPPARPIQGPVTAAQPQLGRDGRLLATPSPGSSDSSVELEPALELRRSTEPGALGGWTETGGGAAAAAAPEEGAGATLLLPSLTREQLAALSATPAPAGAGDTVLMTAWSGSHARPPAPADSSHDTVAMAPLTPEALAALSVGPATRPVATSRRAPAPAPAPASVETTVLRPAASAAAAPPSEQPTVALPALSPALLAAARAGQAPLASSEQATVALPALSPALLAAGPPTAGSDGGKETMMLEALDPQLLRLQDEYQRKQDEAAAAQAEAERLAAEEAAQAARRLRHQRLLTRAIIALAALIVLGGGGVWTYFVLRHPDVPRYSLDPELQAFLAGMPADAAATPLPPPRSATELRAEAAQGLAELAERSWAAVRQSQRSLEIARTHLTGGGQGAARAAAAELLALADELRTLRREAVELKLALPAADDEQIQGIAANARRLGYNLIEVQATSQAALDVLLESLPPAAAAAARSTPLRQEAGAEATTGDARPAPRPAAAGHGASAVGGPDRASASSGSGTPTTPAASTPTVVAALGVAGGARGAAARAGGPEPAAAAAPAAAGGPAATPGALSDEDLLARVLGPQEDGPVAVAGLSCACDTARLARSVAAGARGEELGPCEVQACTRVPVGSSRYADVALDLSRYHFQRKQFKAQLAALQRATNYGRYSHDPAVLFQLIAVAAHLGNFKVAIDAKDRFLYVKELLPPADREKKVPEAYRILGLAFEGRYARQLEDDPARAESGLLNRAVDYLERYSDLAGRPAEMEDKLADLRRLQREGGGSPD